MPRSRLIADSTNPPKKPITQTQKDRPAACHAVNGVNTCRAAPRAVALSTPPIRPSQVFDGDSVGDSLCRPSSFPQTYCNTSLPCTTRIR